MFKTLLTALVGLGLSTAATATTLVEGEHYEVLPEAVETRVDDGQIEITEAFWYGCPHCYNLQGSVSEWYETLDDDVTVVHMPATMGGDWNKHATAFYAAEELGIREQLHADFFDAIHQDGRQLTETDDVAAFFSDYGVSEEEATNALGSFAVKSQVNQANARMRAMRLMGVPALVVDGRYLVSPSSAGSLANMPQIADALVEKVREERAN
ncbi:thiol:disulfide interchange protein DsbA/DsbL [Halomonas urumqiensis]|uniref:Thiol:disulfide interchange protein n=1 Tax=Halomonas urumqiensis TaxID=1684789 RepID=A0A2N7UNW6_9GAMM|nr:thiol:disulfide interchange protein DsbA/DsbL [Halomonas urumqiensis]PMR82137.1 disulfide bond formation protein DsbA [Halomonas urumqiensis]PTB02532.1 thiol:disulfide interchange protein DsbA/DsbL [Halomonas urumqiensis]GHE21006.1 thiol:disulfide interchange protein [Halomonas urumqiensis]